MKKHLLNRSILLLLTIFAVNVTVAQEEKGIKFEKGTLKEALVKAKETGKPIFMDCYTSWCGPCKIMAEKVFTLDFVGDYFNANFINVKFDLEKGEGIEIKKKYEVHLFPTFLIISPDGNEINRIIGSDEPESFIEKVKAAKDPKSSVAILTKRYESGDRDPAFVNKYIETLCESALASKALKVVEDIFPQIDNKKRFKQEYINLYYQMEDCNSPILDYMLAHKQEIKEYISPEMVDGIIANAVQNYFLNVGTGQRSYDKKEYAHAEKLIKKSGVANSIPSVAAMQKATPYAVKKDFNKLIEVCIEQYSNNAYKPMFGLLKGLMGGNYQSFTDAQKERYEYFKTLFKGNAPR